MALIADGLIAVALPELQALDPDGECNVTGALRVARDIEQALADDPGEDARRRLLDAHEREIPENHLVGEIASTLQELIHRGGAARRRHEP